MTFHVAHQSNAGDGARSPFRVIETQSSREVEWVNRFLDRECVRCLANTTLRSYAMDLLHFIRWWSSVNHTDSIAVDALASVLLAGSLTLLALAFALPQLVRATRKALKARTA